MSLPSLKVEAAFGISPTTTPAGGDWIDLTPYVQGITVDRGKDHELATTQAGELTITLNNQDRRFDPTLTTGPYYPNVRPMTRIRITVTRGSSFNVFQGLMDDWGQGWDGRPINGSGPAHVQAHATDMITLLSNHEALSSLVTAILADNPKLYFPLWEDPLSTLPHDLSESARSITSRTGSRCTAVANPLIGGQTAFTWTGSTPGQLVYDGNTPELDVVPKTIETWIKPGGSGVGDMGIFELLAGSAPSAFALAFSDRPELNHFDGNVGPSGAQTILGDPTSWVGGVWAHLVVTIEKSRVRFYKNGVLETERILKGDTLKRRNSVGGEFRFGIEDKFGVAYDGSIAHFAIYDYLLDPARIAVHAALTLDAIGPTDAGTAIGKVLDAIGWPAGDRSIDTNGATVTQTIPEGSALDLVLAFGEQADRGTVFVAGNGKLNFQSRLNQHAKVTVQEAYGDAGGEINYDDATITYDDQNLFGRVLATADVLAAADVSDSTSITTYGFRKLELDTGPLADQNVLVDIANGTLLDYKAPRLRFETVSANGAADDTRLQAILAAAPGRLVTVTRRPPGGGAAISQRCYIEKIHHELSRALGRWRTVIGLVPATTQGWILEDATYGLLGSYPLGW